MMRHYDVATGKPITHEEALSRLPGVVTNPTAGMFESAGVPMVIEWSDTPEGMVTIPASEHYDMFDGFAWQVFDCELTASRDARNQQTEQQRVLALAARYGRRVGILAGILKQYGLEMPIAPDAAFEQVEVWLAQGILTQAQVLTLPLLKDTYELCAEVMTDAETAAVWEIVKGGA
jgi:hypothetical protein